MTVGVSIFNVLNKKFDFNLNDAKFFAGHSLGEYTALVCAGSLTIEKQHIYYMKEENQCKKQFPKEKEL